MKKKIPIISPVVSFYWLTAHLSLGFTISTSIRLSLSRSFNSKAMSTKTMLETTSMKFKIRKMWTLAFFWFEISNFVAFFLSFHLRFFCFVYLNEFGTLNSLIYGFGVWISLILDPSDSLLKHNIPALCCFSFLFSGFCFIFYLDINEFKS